jgi:antitoxin HicB
MLELTYPAKIKTDEDGRFLVVFPDVRGAITDGASKEEALDEAQDCLAEAIAAAMYANEELTLPSPRKRGQVLISLPAPLATKALLYSTLREQKHSNTWLAAQLDVDEKEVRRMLDPYHATKLPRVSEALQVLGKEMVIGVREAGSTYTTK